MTTTTSIPEPTENRPVRLCAKCGERSGSRSMGTGRPLHREADGRWFHIGCRPGAMNLAGALLALEGMGA